MDFEGPKFERKTGYGIKVEMSNSSSLNHFADAKLKNPISIEQRGIKTFIYTEYPLKDVIKEKEEAIRGPVSTETEPRKTYEVDMRHEFLAELEDGILLSSDGQGKYELTNTETAEKITLLDISQELEYLKKASAFEERQEIPGQLREMQILLELHKKRERKK
jgi:hypothetical protein